MVETAYVGLGSNLGDRLAYLRAGVNKLIADSCVQLQSTSSVYATAPVGVLEQPEFLNAVIAVATSLSPEKLLAQMQAIEDRHGRQRAVHWGPRTLDLDLLLFGDRRLRGDTLTIPHPHLTERCFVLSPLCEIAPTLKHPSTGERLSMLLETLFCNSQVQRLNEPLVR